jgi:hypothetical protein
MEYQLSAFLMHWGQLIEILLLAVIAFATITK